MARSKKQQELLDLAKSILANDHPMTVRQLYYQLVARQALDNNLGQYKRVSRLLVEARKDGSIPWRWVEDRLRRPRTVSMWTSLTTFGHAVVNSYHRNVWVTQPGYIETWLEKDALSGVFEDIQRPYGVTLNVGRGFDGWDSIKNAADRMRSGDDVTILYFGDFDPSGEDMVRSLSERLAFFGCRPEIVKCALTIDDITRYNLPPDPVKRTDTRAAGFIARNGDVSVELDALPGAVLRQRIRREIEARLDMDALAEVQRQEKQERRRLLELMEGLS